MKAHLVQIAKTVVLCAGLGLALYYAVEALAASESRDVAVLWLALAAAVGLSFLAVPAFVEGWRTGSLSSKTGRVERDVNPVWYWFLLGIEGATIVSLIALGVWACARLLPL